MDINRVDPRDNDVEGDLIGRDKNVTVLPANRHQESLTWLKGLYEKFEHERSNNIHLSEMIDELDRLTAPKPGETVIGLENKLKAGQREDLLEYALEVKELFSKKLYKLALYQSARTINVHLLALVRTYYMNEIYNRVWNGGNPQEIQSLVQTKIIDPLIELLAGNTLGYTSEDIMGMLYFLTGNCHIKWTK